MAHPIHKHMHTHITKSNVKAAIKDDKAHMDYLKRDIKDDQKFHAKNKDERQLHDEQHITNLAQDVKYDEKKEGVSRNSSPANFDLKKAAKAVGKVALGGMLGGAAGTAIGAAITGVKNFGTSANIKEKKADLEKYNPVDDRATTGGPYKQEGMSRSSSPVNSMGDKNDHDMGPKGWKAHKQTLHGIRDHGGPQRASKSRYTDKGLSRYSYSSPLYSSYTNPKTFEGQGAINEDIQKSKRALAAGKAAEAMAPGISGLISEAAGKKDE